MSYKIEIFNAHEINRDLSTILGNAAKTEWDLYPRDIIWWLHVQKFMFPTWNELNASTLDADKIEISLHSFGEQTKKICTLTLKA